MSVSNSLGRTTMSETEELVSLLSDDTFRAIFQRIDRDIFGQSSFEQLPMPKGYSADETWSVLEAIRRLNSHEFHYETYSIDNKGIVSWCSLGGRISPMLHEIASTARAMRSSDAFNQYSYLDVLAEDLAAAAARDGLAVDEPTTRKLVGHQASPTTRDEAYIANVAAILLEIEKYARYPLSPWMLDEFAIRMEDVPSGIASVGLGAPVFPDTESLRSRIVPTILETMNDSSQPMETYLLNLLATSLVIWDLSPFAKFNSMYELIIRNWALESRSLSYLRNVPFLALCRTWEQEGGQSVGVSEEYYDVIPDGDNDHDSTPFFGNALIMVTRRLRQLEDQRESESGESDVETRARMAYPDINERQLDVLRSHSRNPDQLTTIALHMSLCKVSYGTARSDLLGLSEHGLLVQEWQGRAMVFRNA